MATNAFQVILVLNPKHKILNSKQIQMSQLLNLKLLCFEHLMKEYETDDSKEVFNHV